MSQFVNFTQETVPTGTDHVVGYRTATAGGERRFLLASILSYIQTALAAVFVPITRTVNGHALSANITLTAEDVAVTGVSEAITTWAELGAVATTTLTVGACRIWFNDGAGGDGLAKFVRLVAGTDATDTASGIQRPDDYNGSTNAKVWKQR
jgi:mRNA-degrading endonuclease toxin of MazEF toxin-antitoxin module